MNRPLSVSELNNQIKSLLESTFYKVLAEGEVANLTYHSSGHVYFSIKDENSSIKCTLFKGNASRMKFRLEEGMKVIVDGAISLYTPRGEYNLNCFKIEPSGMGSLALAYEQLKIKLQNQGLFDKKYKKEIPKVISHIAIVTSKTGAAIQDMLKVAQKRWPLLKISLIDTIVQGENAKFDIANNIKIADSLNADVIIVGRGGGSIEDLWAFNEEMVAFAIFEAKTPIVSAVGHEVDYLISDFVADLRAPTPSASMEMILKDRYEALIFIDNLITRFENRFLQIIDLKQRGINVLKDAFLKNSIEFKIKNHQKDIISLKDRFDKLQLFNLTNFQKPLYDTKNQFEMAISSIFKQKLENINSLKAMFESNHPTKRTKRGFAQIIKDKKVVDLKQIKENERFFLEDVDYKVEALAISKKRVKSSTLIA